MMRSVNSTYSAMRRVSRSAITEGRQGQTCVNTPILGTLRHSRTHSTHQPTNPHQRSRCGAGGTEEAYRVGDGAARSARGEAMGAKPWGMAGGRKAGAGGRGETGSGWGQSGG